MPTDQKASTALRQEVGKGYGYFIDSDERIIEFRNQYGEKFVLTPRKAIWFAMFTVFIAGIVVGKIW